MNGGFYNKEMNRERILNEFVTLTGFDSESYNEAEIREYLKEKLNKLGLLVSEDKAGNIYAILPGEKEQQAILFSSHMDTVSPGNGKKAIIKKIDGQEVITSDGNTVLGADDVSGIVSIIEALTVIKEKSISHPDIEVIFSVAEEPYCRGMSAFDMSKVKAKKGYVLDLTGKIGTAAYEAPTIVEIGIEITGKSAHAGFAPEDGINALSIAANALAKLPTGHIYDDTTLNFGLINGGTGVNVVPEKIKIKGEIRSLTYERIEETEERILSIFEEAAANSTGAKADIKYTEKIRGYKIDKDAEVIRDYERAIKSVGIDEATLISTFGGSDANPLNQAGIQTIVLSCAMENVHTTQEYAVVSELIKSAEVTLKLMTK